MTIDTTVTILPGATDIPAHPAAPGSALVGSALVGSAPAGSAFAAPAAAPACTARPALGVAVGVVAAMRHLAAAALGARGWDDAEQAGMIAHLDVAIGGLTAVRAKFLIAQRDAGAHKGSGDGSFPIHVGRTSRDGAQIGGRRVREAEQLDAVPAVTAEVTGGTIGLEHANIIAELAAEGTDAQRAAATSVAGQEHLLGLARVQDAATFKITVAAWAATVDPPALEHGHETQRANRFLHLSHTPVGTKIKGLLDAIAGHSLALALEALTPASSAGDDRDFGQRRADALDTMATTILGLDDTKPGGNVSPHISFILTETTLCATKRFIAIPA